MRIGLIGYGAWGRHHADAIRETRGLELAGVCAASEESRAAARDALGVPVYAHYPDLLASGLDAVDIVTPTDLHHAMASAALDAGLHVLLEKPMAAGVEQCHDLIARARRARRTLHVGHEFRLSTQWGRVRTLIEEDAIGMPQYANIDLWRRPYRDGSARWRWTASRVGSWVLEEPVHFFDAGAWWMREAGPPLSIYARAARLPASPEGLWDNMTAVVNFASGAHLTVTHSLAICEHHLAAKVVGDRGAILGFWDGEMDRTTHPSATLKLFRGGRLEEIPIAASGEFFELRAELAHFREVCAGRAALVITPEEAAFNIAMCWAAERSIASGKAESV